MLSSPTCVGLWYGRPRSSQWLFLAAMNPAPSPSRGRAPSALASGRIFPRPSSARAFRGLFRQPARSVLACRHHRKRGRRGNVDPLPVGYGPHPRLRGRLTLGQIAFTLETSGFRRRGIPPLFHVTHACILSAAPSTGAPAPASPACGMLSYRPLPQRKGARGFGCALSPAELSARGYSTSELLRTPWRRCCL